MGGKSIGLVSLQPKELPSHVFEHPWRSDNHHGGSNPDGEDSEADFPVMLMKLPGLPHRGPNYQQMSLSSVSKKLSPVDPAYYSMKVLARRPRTHLVLESPATHYPHQKYSYMNKTP